MTQEQNRVAAILVMAKDKMAGLTGDMGVLAEQAGSDGWADENMLAGLENLAGQLETRVQVNLREVTALVSAEIKSKKGEGSKLAVDGRDMAGRSALIGGQFVKAAAILRALSKMAAEPGHHVAMKTIAVSKAAKEARDGLRELEKIEAALR